MAVMIDVGNPNDVHPKDKEPVGDGLAVIALAKVYGQKMEYPGPVYQSMKINGNSVVLSFTHTTGGLRAKDGSLRWFQIAGTDQRFVDATATIQGDTIVVHGNAVSHPVAVRYAWADYPGGCNLYNGAGLPAAPFRTDHWDALTPIAAKFTGR